MKNKLIRKYVFLHLLRIFQFFILVYGIFFVLVFYALIKGVIVGTPNLYEGILNGILVLLIFSGVYLIPLGVVTAFYIIRFVKLIKYQEQKYNISFDDANAKYIRNTPELFWKIPYFLCDEWLIASGVCAFYYKDIQKVKRKRVQYSLRLNHRVYFKYIITSSNGKNYSFCTTSAFLNVLNKWLKKNKGVKLCS